MAVPDFLSDTVAPWYYHQTTAITDVTTIISDVRTALVTNLSWTEPSTALFVSPVDNNRFMDILLTRISATNLDFRIRDQRGLIIRQGRIQIDASTNVNYFCTKFSMVVESLRATPELAQAYILDQSPNNQSDAANYVVCNTYRTTGDAISQGGKAGELFGYDGVTIRMPRPCNVPGTVVTWQTTAGTLLYRDILIRIAAVGGANLWHGRIFQGFMCDPSISFGVDKVIPIDDATTATFRVLGLATVDTGTRICLRKA